MLYRNKRSETERCNEIIRINITGDVYYGDKVVLCWEAGISSNTFCSDHLLGIIISNGGSSTGLLDFTFFVKYLERKNAIRAKKYIDNANDPKGLKLHNRGCKPTESDPLPISALKGLNRFVRKHRKSLSFVFHDYI